MLRRARTWKQSGSLSNAKRSITLGRRSLNPDGAIQHRRAAARLDSFDALIAMSEGRPEAALEAAQRAATIAAEAHDDEALARSYITLDWAHHMLGQPDQATNGERALEILLRLGHLRRASDVMNNEGGYAYYAGQWDQAIAWYRRSRDASQRSGSVVDTALVGLNIGEVLIGQRRFAAADVELQETYRVLRAADAKAFLVSAEMQMARLDLEMGNAPRAIEALERLFGLLNRAGNQVASLEVAIHLCDALVREQRPSRRARAHCSRRERSGLRGRLLCIGPLEGPLPSPLATWGCQRRTIGGRHGCASGGRRRTPLRRGPLARLADPYGSFKGARG